MQGGIVALRTGWWHDPVHALSITNGILPRPPLTYVAAIVSEDENHATAGISVGRKTRFELSIERGTRSSRAAFGVVSTF